VSSPSRGPADPSSGLPPQGPPAQRVTARFAVVLVLAALGLWIARSLPVGIFPTVTFPIVKLIADAGEAPTAQMIPTVTRPLEEAVRHVPGVTSVHSITSRGSAELSVSFAWGTDMQIALQQVQSEANRVRGELPPDTTLEAERMSPASFPVQGYALTSRTQTQAELRALADFTLRPALLRIPGVSQVQVQGGREREFQIWLDPLALDAHGLSVPAVIDALQAQDQVISAGLTEDNHELYLALVDGRVDSVVGLQALRVPVQDGPPVALSELGEVQVADATTYVRTTADGEDAVLINVLPQPSANTLAIADGVTQRLADQPELLPAGVSWTTFYDQARFVRDSVTGTRDAILIGVALAALVLLLRQLRATTVAVVVIPLAVAIIATPLALLGQSINLRTLAGIAAAIGLIADDAIVVIEHMEHHARTDGATGLGHLLPALVGSSLSTTVILLPFALLSGVVGAFFRPLALTLALALVASFLLAWLVVPAAMGELSHGPLAPVVEPFVEPQDRWTTAVRTIVTRPWLALPATLLLLGLTVLGYHQVGTDFLPAMDEGAIVLDYVTPPGTSLSETDAMLNDAEAALRTVPDVAGYSRRTGTQLGFYVTEPNTGDTVINLKLLGQRRPVDEVIDDIRARVQAVQPGIQVDFGQLIEDEIGDLTGGSPQPIDVRIYGEDASQLRTAARQVAGILSTVPGVEDVFDGITVAGPALRIRVDPAAAARHGLSTQDIHAAVEPRLTGTVIDRVLVGERVLDLRVRLRSDRPLAELGLPLPGEPGATVPSSTVPLSAVAQVLTGEPEVEIDREDLQTYVGVTARLSGRDLGSAVADVRQALDQQLHLGPGMHLRMAGLYEQQTESFQQLLEVLLADLVLVGIVVLFEFGDWRAPLLVMLSAVSVLSGVLGALVLTGTTLDISSFVGAIMMVGIVGENAIFVIHDARIRLVAGIPVPQAWTEAARRRLRFVAMTVLATACALAPLALGMGQGSQLVRPLAIAVIGGFVVSAPIVLLLLPALYAGLDPQGRLGTQG